MAHEINIPVEAFHGGGDGPKGRFVQKKPMKQGREEMKSLSHKEMGSRGSSQTKVLIHKA